MTRKLLSPWRSLFAPLVVISALAAQQADTASSPTNSAPQSLGDAARRQRAIQSGAVSTQPADAQPAGQQDKSVAEVAAERRAKRQAEVKITEKDKQELFSEMDTILGFASGDSGLPRRSPVRHQLVSQEDVKRFMSESLAKSAETQRVARSEIVLKKFGYLPPGFDLKSYVIKAVSQSIAGYYDPKTKTMNLLSWVGLEQQRPIMAHELTHALQDQNYDLETWMREQERPPAMRVVREEAQESGARSAVVEGQAMIVYMDYLLKPYGRTLSDTPKAIEFLKGGMAQSYDTSLVIHNAPLLMKDTAIFPYREGLLFELELLRKGGTNLAFAGAFSHPPVNTHEVLEPAAYLGGEKIPAVTLPDLSPVLANDYEVYDSGTMGELDVRILSQQLGSENDMFTVTPNWRGGAYVAVKRKSASGPAATATTADVALLYVSRWKTPEAAQRFMEIYWKSLPKRIQVSPQSPTVPSSCDGSECPLPRTARLDTSEGPVFLELLPNNTVFIAQSFPEETAKSLRQVVLTRGSENSAGIPAPELTLKLMELPAFQALQEQMWRSITKSLAEAGALK